MAPNVTGRPSLEGRAVASRQVVLLFGEVGAVTGCRARGRLRENQLACALVDGYEDEAGLAGQSRLETGVELKLRCGSL